MKLDPEATNVQRWLKTLSREKLHEQGWITVNKRFHGITRSMRPFLRERFPDGQEQQAAFDGLTLALLTIAHFEDIALLTQLLGTELPAETAKTSDLPEPTTTPPPA